MVKRSNNMEKEYLLTHNDEIETGIILGSLKEVKDVLEDCIDCDDKLSDYNIYEVMKKNIKIDVKIE